MQFNTFQFVIFYTVICLTYFALPRRWRWMLLLAASYSFYMFWKAEYGLILLASTWVDYWVAIRLHQTTARAARRSLVWISLCANLGLLFGFKYADFLTANLIGLGGFFGWSTEFKTLDLLLPIGISFYTFQSMSYTLDVYRGAREPERHFGYFAVYVSFFPQLIAGPIERSSSLIPQLRAAKMPLASDIKFGFQRMLWGAFKKIVIADQAAVVVDRIYQSPGDFPGPAIIFATLLFAIQIYSDFSAYSDIAIGSARVMGIRLSENFRRPFFASSLRDYWRRRHITLVSWFRDYVYIPLGGNRGPSWRTYTHVLVVFVLSGLWHGAAWTFVIWGAFHGVCLVIESSLRRYNDLWLARLGSLSLRLWFGLRHAWVLCCVLIGYALFRSASFADAFQIFSQVTQWTIGLPYLGAPGWRFGLPQFELIVLLVMIGVLFSVDWIEEHQTPWALRLWSMRPVRWMVYFAGLYSIVFFGSFGKVEFIYFQF